MPSAFSSSIGSSVRPSRQVNLGDNSPLAVRMRCAFGMGLVAQAGGDGAGVGTDHGCDVAVGGPRPSWDLLGHHTNPLTNGCTVPLGLSPPLA